MSKRPSGRAARRNAFLLFGAVLLALGLAGCAASIKEKNAVHVITIDGEINPVMARYVESAIGAAEDSDAAAVVLRLDTPGGLDSSMRDIVQRIESSRVPVITYVSPPGARAASAGTFITLAGNVAAMAPNTAIGAAHPVGAGGQDIEGTMGDKVTNDAAAYITGIAKLRGRNVDWAESAVRQSISADEQDAVQLNVVDLVAPDLPSLLAAVNGRSVELLTGPAILQVANAPIVENNMSLVQRFFLILSDPNIAFILLSVGLAAIAIEMLHPGFILPGVVGSIALLLAFFSLGTLPVNWAGVLLILLAFALFIAELLVQGFGALGVGGIVSLILGGLLLTSTSNPEFQVSRWLIYGWAAVIGAFFLMVMSTILRMRRMLPAKTGALALVGRVAVARSPLEPSGQVFLQGERWQATSEDGPVEVGERVIVTGVRGFRLTVRKAPGEGRTEPPAGDDRPEARRPEEGQPGTA
jgi:membrane-bound serine protease (ClpP class)